jgi:hypothetical protein
MRERYSKVNERADSHLQGRHSRSSARTVNTATAKRERERRGGITQEQLDTFVHIPELAAEAYVM